MSFFTKFFRRRGNSGNSLKWADMLNGYMPIFSSFGNDIYASDVVQQAINCIVSEMQKLTPMHIKRSEDIAPVKSSVANVLKKPNPLMTTYDFIGKIMWLLMLNYNAFIIPDYYYWDEEGSKKKYYTAFYPVNPDNVEFLQDSQGDYFVKFTFRNGYETTLLYSDVIHIRHKYSVNEFMGGNEQGRPDNKALLKTLDLNEQLLNGVAKAMKSSYSVNGVVKYNTIMDKGKTEKALKELEEKLRNSEDGFLPLDLSASYMPLERKVQLVDDSTLKFIDEKILRNFGVPLCILSGDYTKAQYEAFYQKTLEPLIYALSQGFTRGLFTDREIMLGHEVKFYPKDLIFMSVSETLEMVNLLSNTGGLYENEKRSAFGLRPLPELNGKRYMSLNWIDADKAAQYQVGQKDNAQSTKDG